MCTDGAWAVSAVEGSHQDIPTPLGAGPVMGTVAGYLQGLPGLSYPHSLNMELQQVTQASSRDTARVANRSKKSR